MFMAPGTAHTLNIFGKRSLSQYASYHPIIPLNLVALTIAKKPILMNWKSRNTIHNTHWKNIPIDFTLT